MGNAAILKNLLGITSSHRVLILSGEAGPAVVTLKADHLALPPALRLPAVSAIPASGPHLESNRGKTRLRGLLSVWNPREQKPHEDQRLRRFSTCNSAWILYLFLELNVKHFQQWLAGRKVPTKVVDDYVSVTACLPSLADFESRVDRSGNSWLMIPVRQFHTSIDLC